MKSLSNIAFIAAAFVIFSLGQAQATYNYQVDIVSGTTFDVWPTVNPDNTVSAYYHFWNATTLYGTGTVDGYYIVWPETLNVTMDISDFKTAYLTKHLTGFKVACTTPQNVVTTAINSTTTWVWHYFNLSQCHFSSLSIK